MPLRFRPIMMTTIAAIMGALPIALGTAPAELRQPLGIAVVGGLIMSQLLTLFITPVLYLFMDGARGGLGTCSAAGGAKALRHRPRARHRRRPSRKRAALR